MDFLLRLFTEFEVGQEDLSYLDKDTETLNKPDKYKPDVKKPDINKPDINKPDIYKPDIKKPDIYKPDKNKDGKKKKDNRKPDWRDMNMDFDPYGEDEFSDDFDEEEGDFGPFSSDDDFGPPDGFVDFEVEFDGPGFMDPRMGKKGSKRLVNIFDDEFRRNNFFFEPPPMGPYETGFDNMMLDLELVPQGSSNRGAPFLTQVEFDSGRISGQNQCSLM